jgi:undecaprenyl diphosphate synthase
MDEIVRRTAHNTGMILNIAVSYSGRREIVNAAREIALKAARGEFDATSLDEDIFSQHLSTAGLPDLDLHIRCGGVNRLSNFLLWQMAYTEQLFLDRLWPDFTVADLQRALEYYARQQRKFGKVIG